LAKVPKEDKGTIRIAFSGKRNLLFTVGQNTVVYARNGDTLKEEYTMLGHNFAILCIELSQEEDMLFTGSDNG